MTDPELRKRVQRFFFAMDHFLMEPEHSCYWLEEMKHNRELIESHFDKETREEADSLQLKLKI